MSISIVSAILPVLILLWFIYKKDKYEPEPRRKLLAAFFLGCLSVIPASLMEEVINLFTPSGAVAGGLFQGYVLAGFSEEFCKLGLLMWLIWKSPEFDEYFDGIIYAVYLSLGFACVENIMYVLGNEDPLTVALTRGLLAVPAHFLFAVTMGYFLSLAKFDPMHRRWHLWKAFLCPMLLHGTYDSLLMVCGGLVEGYEDEVTVNTGIAGLLIVAFLVFDIMMWRWGVKRIKRMQELSKNQNFNLQNPFDDFHWNAK